MSSHPRSRPKTRQILVLVLVCLGLAASAVAQTEQAIYNFTNAPNPAPNLTADSAGNLYATIWPVTVFQLSPSAAGDWTFTTLGEAPGDVSSLAVDKNGNVFGTTETGGVVTPVCPQGCGTIFEFSQVGGTWQETTISQFAQGAGNQIAPTPLGITLGKNGVLYATAKYAGKFGAVYALVPQSDGSWKLALVYQFQGGADGERPNGSFAIDKQGNLYGTTEAGGLDIANCAAVTGISTCGTVFKLTPPASGGTWTKTTLYEFTGPPNDGNFPNGGLLRDAAGNIYGTTRYGGASFNDEGTAFKLTSSAGTWTETVLHSFSNKPDGYEPIGLTAVPGGVLYGVTGLGGAYKGGTIFQLANSGGTWTEKVVYSFQQGDSLQGSEPDSNLVYLSGVLYGGTSTGGTGSNCTFGCGVIYQITK
jgi:uncharacterized repeat protein (TIGR03803 family)